MDVKKIVFLLMLILVFSGFISAADLEGISDDYRHILKRWVNSELSPEQMFRQLSVLDAEISSRDVSRETLFWRSRIAFLRGQIYYEQGDKKPSIRELESCLSFAEKANEYEETSEVLSTMAEANSLLMLQKGFLFIVANYSVPQTQAERALSLDPANSAAALVRAQFLCNAPSIAGGDLEEGISILTELSKRTESSDTDRFFALQSLAEVHRNNEKDDRAAAACRQALRLFPRNETCLAILSELEG